MVIPRLLSKENCLTRREAMGGQIRNSFSHACSGCQNILEIKEETRRKKKPRNLHFVMVKSFRKHEQQSSVPATPSFVMLNWTYINIIYAPKRV